MTLYELTGNNAEPKGPTGVKIGDVVVMKNDMLPPGWMVVAPDVYELLTATPESHAAGLADFKGKVDQFETLLKKNGLSPTGRQPSEPRYQELPKCCVPTAEEEMLLATGEYTPEELWGGRQPTCPKCIKERK